MFEENLYMVYFALFGWLWLSGADLLWEKNTTVWLVASADLLWKKSIIGWLIGTELEYKPGSLYAWCYKILSPVFDTEIKNLVPCMHGTIKSF